MVGVDNIFHILKWDWSAMFVVGCCDFGRGGGVFSLCSIYKFGLRGSGLLNNSASITFKRQNSSVICIYLYKTHAKPYFNLLKFVFI